MTNALSSLTCLIGSRNTLTSFCSRCSLLVSHWVSPMIQWWWLPFDTVVLSYKFLLTTVKCSVIYELNLLLPSIGLILLLIYYLVRRLIFFVSIGQLLFIDFSASLTQKWTWSGKVKTNFILNLEDSNRFMNELSSEPSSNTCGTRTNASVALEMTNQTNCKQQMQWLEPVTLCSANAAKYCFKPKRIRTSFKRTQLDILRECFKRTHKPNSSELCQLVHRIGLSRRVIQVSQLPPN